MLDFARHTKKNLKFDTQPNSPASRIHTHTGVQAWTEMRLGREVESMGELSPWLSQQFFGRQLA
jgi:hypothetical protein